MPVAVSNMRLTRSPLTGVLYCRLLLSSLLMTNSLAFNTLYPLGEKKSGAKKPRLSPALSRAVAYTSDTTRGAVAPARAIAPIQPELCHHRVL